VNKTTKIVLVVAVLAVLGYFGWKVWSNYQASKGNPNAASEGTNLNSAAPQLVGGSTGPSVGAGPALPITINVTEQAAPKGSDPDRPRKEDEMEGSVNTTPAAITSQTRAASAEGVAQVNDSTPSPTTPEPGDYERMT
jgi:hypothetical protein